MKKSLFVIAALISSLFCSPALAQDTTTLKNEYEKENYKVYAETVENLDDDFADLIANGFPKDMYCTATNVNVRQEPNTNCKIYDRLQRGTTVEAIATDGKWVCITTQDGIAFVYGEYLKDVVTVPEGESNRWSLELTEEEYELVARIGMLECGGEPDIGQQAVFEVIFNRVFHEKYPNDVTEVLSQKGQFSTWKNRNIKRATPSEKIYKNLDLVLAGQTNILPYETVYFSIGAQNKRVQERIGCHVFCNY